MNSRLLGVLCAIGFSFCLFPDNASSATIFSKPVDPTQFVMGSNKTVVGDLQTADEFELSADAELSAIAWYGGVVGNPGVDTDGGLRDFTIQLYLDDNGLPSELPFFEQSITASVADTGLIGLHPNHNSMPIYRYTSSIDSINLFAGTTYWISTLNEDPVDGSQWVWQASSYTSGGYVATRTWDQPRLFEWGPITEVVRNNMAFELMDASPVPIPPPL